MELPPHADPGEQAPALLKIEGRYEITFGISGHGRAGGRIGAEEQPMVGESNQGFRYVWAIMGFPNIAIVVGSRATQLSIPAWAKNGATAARVAANCAQQSEAFPHDDALPSRHAGGEPGLRPAPF